MILNAYTVLDAFLVLLRLGLGALALVIGIAAWKASSSAVTCEHRTALEDRFYLLFLLALVLVALNVASWPVLYLLLDSYVPQWTQAMCIYGVTQVGKGSSGIARWLPFLVQAVQWSKPVIVFASGAWFVLYLLQRQSPDSVLMRRGLALLILLGLLAMADSAVEGAYLLIPKKEEFPSTGCCTTSLNGISPTERFLPDALLGGTSDDAVTVLYYGFHAALVVALSACHYATWVKQPMAWSGPLLLGAVASLAVTALFLIQVAAPTLLHLPYHHCAYDLIREMPEMVLAMMLSFLGNSAVGWAAVVGWLGCGTLTTSVLQEQARKLFGIALFGHAVSVGMISVELALA